jgi:hypothetical protein
MLIYSGIITLNYHPSTDILETSMPDVRQFASSEVSFCLGLIIDTIRNYNIKNLLLDSSKTVIEAEDEAYKAIIAKFGMDLMSSQLKKLARISTQDVVREERSAKISGELKEELNLPISFKNFTNKAEAIKWLKSE